VLTDDIIRTGLDRKGRVYQIKQRVEQTISQSKQMLSHSKSKSPRNRSISPYNSSVSSTQMPNMANQVNAYAGNYIRCDDRKPPQQRVNFKNAPASNGTRFADSNVKTYMQHRAGSNRNTMNDSSYMEHQHQSYYGGNDSPLRNSPPRK
jgi:hypothetical protein